MGYWYALQVISSKEKRAQKSIQKKYSQLKTLLPMRELSIRKGGSSHLEVKPLFAGYLFLFSDKALDRMFFRQMQESLNIGLDPIILKVIGVDYSKEDGFVYSVSQEEMDFILEITQQGEVIHFSEFIKEGSQVKIISGPLLNREVIVKKVDPRKNRITVEINLLGKAHRIDLGGKMVRSI